RCARTGTAGRDRGSAWRFSFFGDGEQCSLPVLTACVSRRGMARTDRLFRLMHLLRLERPPVTAQSLATALEVTPRTIYRDIGALRAAGAVIDGDAGYGYTLIEDIAMPPQALDRFEAEAVVLGLAALEGFGDPGLSRAARNAGAKI